MGVSTVDTSMGPQCRDMRAADLSLGHCRDSRGALAFDMLPRFAIAIAVKLLFYVLCTDKLRLGDNTILIQDSRELNLGNERERKRKKKKKQKGKG